MENTIWARAALLDIRTAPHITPGFSIGFDDAVSEKMRCSLIDFITWVEKHFALPVPLWVDFEWKHYVVARNGRHVGYLFYWPDVDLSAVFDDENATPMIRLPVRNERWGLNSILGSFAEGLTDYYAWLCGEKLDEEKKEDTVATILEAYFMERFLQTMQIIDYFACDNQTHWRAAIAQNEWRAAKFLAILLEKGEFHQNVGKGTIYLLTEGDRLVSFLTLSERDCVDVPYGPWIGFVHTAPEYRGHRHVGKLIDHACHAAREQGVTRVYLATDHVGLYEKYGFTYLENRVNVYGEDSRIYVREVSHAAY